MVRRRRPRIPPLRQQIENQCRLKQLSRGALFKNLRLKLDRLKTSELVTAFEQAEANYERLLRVGSVCTVRTRAVVHIRLSVDRMRGMSSDRYCNYSGRRSYSRLNDR